MAITRYRTRSWPTAWQELEEMSNRLSRVFNDVQGTGTENTNWMPAVNVEESKDGLFLTAELPGMSHDDVEIELENNVLTISGTKQQEREEKDDRRYHLWERRWGAFQRSFTLPRTVDADQINATFENGVLTIHMPKAPEAQGRKIEIRSESSAN
jgi:HSP20 family protein